MNSRFEAKLGMFETADMFIENNTTEANSIGTILAGTYQTDLQTKIDAVNAFIITTGYSTIPYTEDKREKRETMQMLAAGVAAAMYAYATTTGLTTLAEQVKPWRRVSAFVKLKDTIVNNQCQTIHDWAAPIVGETPNPLIPYGVTVTDITTTLIDAIDAYNAVLEVPEAKIEQRKAWNQELVLLYKDIDDLLGLMDDVIYNAGPGHEDFQLGWKAARTIFDPVTTHTGFRGTVTNGETLLPIQGVTVTATPSNVAPPGEDGVPVSTVTDENGYYTLATPQYKNNPYTLSFTKTGLQSVIVTDQYVKRGVKNTKDQAMLPVA